MSAPLCSAFQIYQFSSIGICPTVGGGRVTGNIPAKCSFLENKDKSSMPGPRKRVCKLDEDG